MITIITAQAGLIRIMYRSLRDNQTLIEVNSSYGKHYKHKTKNTLHGCHFDLVVEPGESLTLRHPDKVKVAWRQVNVSASYTVAPLEDIVTIQADSCTVSSPQPNVVALRGPKDAGIAIQATEDVYIRVSADAPLITNLNNTEIKAMGNTMLLTAYTQIVLRTTEPSEVHISRIVLALGTPDE